MNSKRQATTSQTTYNLDGTTITTPIPHQYETTNTDKLFDKSCLGLNTPLTN